MHSAPDTLVLAAVVTGEQASRLTVSAGRWWLIEANGITHISLSVYTLKAERWLDTPLVLMHLVAPWWLPVAPSGPGGSHWVQMDRGR